MFAILKGMGKASRNKKNSEQPPMTAREKLRAEQAKAAKKKDHTQKLWIAGVVAAITVIAITVALAIGMGNKEVTTAQVEAPNLAANGKGIKVLPDIALKDGAPLVEVYEDYQCPGCAMAHQVYGPIMKNLALNGEIDLQYNTMTFLDAQSRGANANSSSRAAFAASCADTVGRFLDYHNTVYINQPREGSGYSDQQLRETFAQRSGIKGDSLTKFQSCYDDRATQKLVQDIAEAASRDGVSQTPTYKVNGKTLDLQTLSEARDEKSVLEMLKKVGNS